VHESPLALNQFRFDLVGFSWQIGIMPKMQNALAGHKRFTLANGETRTLPAWANDPLPFAFSPDEALRRGGMAKPHKNWKKALREKRMARK
jgi:hypothetical protein